MATTQGNSGPSFGTTLDAEAVAEVFDLGPPIGRSEPVATGWGGHNLIWRVHTSDGLWAVKAIRRPAASRADEAFAIEQAAFDAGIPAARPVRSRRGNCYELVAGTLVRCHEWVAGSAKANEEAAAFDARRMGRIVAELHALRITADERPEGLGRPFTRDSWLELAAQADADPPWRAFLVDRVDDLVRIDGETSSRQAAIERDGTIGSHRDLNAHNVLFADDRLVLVDWDSAGPASPRFERAAFPVLWAQNDGGGYDLDTVVAFLRGYRDAGGLVLPEDTELLWDWLGGAIRWTQINLRLAIELKAPEQDESALHLLDYVLRGPDGVATMQTVLRHAIDRL